MQLVFLKSFSGVLTMNSQLVALLVLALTPSIANAKELAFGHVLTLRSPSGLVGIAPGDINGDGQLDLVAVNSVGDLDVFLQDSLDRMIWQKISRRLGLPMYMVQTADLNHDGYAEILFGDISTSAYLIRNQGGVLESKPFRLTSTRGARWVTVGDWNKDGHRDVATAEYAHAAVSILSGDGQGGLNHLGSHEIQEPHCLESADLDRDGDLDLFVGWGDKGMRTMEGNGKGTFAAARLIPQATPIGRFVFPGDFNEDGRSDVAITGLRSVPTGVLSDVYVGINKGDGTFEPSLRAETQQQSMAAVGDFNGDGHSDLARVSLDSSLLSVHRGRGDGTFEPLEQFGPAGLSPTFIVAADLDADGRQDIAISDSSTVRVFWGLGEKSMLDSSKLVTGHVGTIPCVADFDGDGAPDFFFPNSKPQGVDLYVGPGFQSAVAPQLTIPTEIAYSSVRAADVNGDEMPDLLGVSTKPSNLGVAFLSKSGGALKQVAFPVGSFPGPVEVGLIDEGETLDVAVPCFGSNEIRLFLGRGGDTLEAGPVVSTFESPKFLQLGDVDSDGKLDMAVTAALGVVVVHFNRGGGAFTEAVPVYPSETLVSFLDFALGDVTGDSRPDLVLSIARRTDLLVIPSKGNREFESPIPLTFLGRPRSISLADLDSDGLLDLSVSQLNYTFSFLYSRGKGLFESALEPQYVLPLAAEHEVLDLNQDGALDLAVYSPGITAVLTGKSPNTTPHSDFRRGDADVSGKVDLTDAIVILQHLFKGGASLCEKASDADDDGRLSLTDGLQIVQWLFQGAQPLGAPGPEVCGEDPTPDELKLCAPACQ